MVEKLHPAIKVIRETPKIVDAFSPLVDVPAISSSIKAENDSSEMTSGIT